MSEETIGEIRADFGRTQTEILTRYRDNVNEIAGRGPETVANS